MDSNLNKFSPNNKMDDSRGDLSKLINKEQDAMISSQHQMSNNPEKKATHSEIEKRRRQKMNKHLNELVFHLPMTMNKNKKPDKITILKMAVQHMKNLKASSSILSDSFLCQNYITPFELQSLVLKESEEFLLVIKCDSSKILYASESSSNCIGFSSSDLIDKVFFEIVHPSDSKQVKDQLTYFDQQNAIGSVNNFMLNKTKTYTTGDRRSFICRIRTGTNQDNRQSSDHVYTNVENKKPEYKTVHFVGFLRSDLNSNLKFGLENDQTSSGQQTILSPNVTNSSESSGFFNNMNTAKMNAFKNFHSITMLKESSNFNSDSQLSNNSSNDTGQAQTSSSISPNINNNNSNSAILEYYLIAYGQINSKTEESSKHKFISRHDSDGKYIYIEPGVHSLIGYLPHQLLSESLFNHVHTDDVNLLKKAFQEVVSNPSKNNKIRTHEYRFRLENNTYVTMESVLYALQNPFNSQLEYIISQNTLRTTPVNILQNQNKTPPLCVNQPIYQKSSYFQQTSLINPLLNSQNISMPMTPSPEESIFSNETNNTEKLNHNLNDFPQTSKTLTNYQMHQKNMMLSPGVYNTNRLTNVPSPQFRPLNQLLQQKQQINYTQVYQQPINQTPSNESKMYQMVDSSSFPNNFINTDTDFNLNNRIFQQQHQQIQSQQQQQQVQNSTNDDSNSWMMQLFDNSDSNSNTDLNFKKT